MDTCVGVSVLRWVPFNHIPMKEKRTRFIRLGPVRCSEPEDAFMQAPHATPWVGGNTSEDEHLVHHKTGAMGISLMRGLLWLASLVTLQRPICTALGKKYLRLLLEGKGRLAEWVNVNSFFSLFIEAWGEDTTIHSAFLNSSLISRDKVEC